MQGVEIIPDLEVSERVSQSSEVRREGTHDIVHRPRLLERRPSWWDSRVWRKFRRHKLAMTGAMMVGLLVLLAIAAPVLAPVGPLKIDMRQSEQPPSHGHPLGTDSLGRDVWARVLFGARVSLSVGFGAVAINTLIGTLLGVISGYYGGVVDSIIQRLTEILMSFPWLIVMTLVMALFGTGLRNLILVIGLLGWTGMARIVRAEVLSLRERDFIVAARCIGASDARIMLRHILPNLVAPVTVTATLGVAWAILTESGLSFLGLGVNPPTPSWGIMMQEGLSLNVLESQPWMWLPPGLMISVSVLSVNFLGDGLRDALDPRMWE